MIFSRLIVLCSQFDSRVTANSTCQKYLEIGKDDFNLSLTIVR